MAAGDCHHRDETRREQAQQREQVETTDAKLWLQPSFFLVDDFLVVFNSLHMKVAMMASLEQSEE